MFPKFPHQVYFVGLWVWSRATRTAFLWGLAVSAVAVFPYEGQAACVFGGMPTALTLNFNIQV